MGGGSQHRYEMHMFHRASLKLGLDRAVLQHMRNENEQKDEHPNHDGFENENSKMLLQTKEIDELLKRGAYDIFREDDTYVVPDICIYIYIYLYISAFLVAVASRSLLSAALSLILCCSSAFVLCAY
jgi:hypothetical protein